LVEKRLTKLLSRLEKYKAAIELLEA